MKKKLTALAVSLGLVSVMVWAGVAGSAPGAMAQEHPEPGMCNGRRDPNVHITAHSNGRGDTKFILNIATDASANAAGVLVLGRGGNRIQVTDWCRVWQHTPDSQPGEHCEADGPPEGAITAHAVGTSSSRSGESLLVRVDVRQTEEGRFFRVRYRPMGQHEDHDEGGESGCDGAWTTIPEEGWAPLDFLRVGDR